MKPGGRASARLATLCGCLLAAVLASRASAQVVLFAPVPAYDEPRAQLGGGVESQFAAGIEGAGNFDALRFDVGLVAGGPTSQNVHLALTTRYTHTAYDFGHVVATAPACAVPGACFEPAPWSDVHRFDFAPSAALVLNDHIQIMLLAPLRWEAESDSDASGVTVGVIGALRLALADPLTITLGVGVQNELEDDALVFPALSMRWDLAPGLAFETRGGPYQGGGARLIWRPQNPVRVELAAGYDRRRFRLRQGGSVHANGVGEYRAVPITLGFGLRLLHSTRLDVRGGIAVAGRLRLEDSSGRRLRAADFDTAGLIRAALSIGF